MLARACVVAEPVDSIALLIAEGNHRGAVSQCVSRHGAALGRMCMALLGSQADADEVVQETLLAAHRAMASYRGEGTVRAWLFGIARRQCARHLEKKQRHRRHLHLVPEPPPGENPEGSLAAKQRAERVRSALARLKPSEREALVLRYQADLSFREIASIFGIEEAAARKRASRGLHRLRALLGAEVTE